LAEDAPYGYLTIEHLGIGEQSASIVFKARTTLTVCGVEEVARVFVLAGASAAVVTPSGAISDGLQLTAKGGAATLHRVWKTAQVLVEFYSGITSATASIIQLLHNNVFTEPLTCTRKYFPGTKELSLKAVRSSGAYMHRLGHSKTLLLFHEHHSISGRTRHEHSRAAEYRVPGTSVSGGSDRRNGTPGLGRGGCTCASKCNDLLIP
jgi:molybdenum transport protein